MYTNKIDFKKFQKTLLLIILVVILLFSVNNFSRYRISLNQLESYSKKEARNQNILLPEIMETVELDNEDTIINIIISEQNKDEFGLVVLNKSLFSEKYKLSRSIFNLKFGDKYSIKIRNPRKTIDLEIDAKDKAKVNLLVKDEKDVLLERILLTIVIIIGVVFFLFWINRKSKNK